MKIGYAINPEGTATYKYEIVDETISGKYVAMRYNGLRIPELIGKDRMLNIEEEVSNEQL